MGTSPFPYTAARRSSICRGADPLLLDSPCPASLLTLDRRCPRCDIASFYVWTDDVHFGHRVLVSPSFGDFTSPIPAPLLVRNVIHDSHRCPSRLDVEYPPGLFCHREENLKRQAETGNMTCNAGALQGKTLFPCSLRTTRNARWPDRSPAPLSLRLTRS